MKDERHFRNSVIREQIIEHVFVGELLRYLWNNKLHNVQILRSEIDVSGYDIVITHEHFIRYVQLKTSVIGGKVRVQKINGALVDVDGGCIIWIVVDDKLYVKKYLWYGGRPRERLEQIRNFNRAKKANRNAAGQRSNRTDTYIIPRSEFSEVSDMEGIVTRLMGNRID